MMHKVQILAMISNNIDKQFAKKQSNQTDKKTKIHNDLNNTPIRYHPLILNDILPTALLVYPATNYRYLSPIHQFLNNLLKLVLIHWIIISKHIICLKVYNIASHSV